MTFKETAQPIFDKVVRHVVKQGCRAVKSFPPEVGDKPILRCVYRGDNGTSCAIGCLIKDEHYKPELNESSLTSYGVIGMLAKSLDMSEGAVADITSFLLDLQNAHDHTDGLGQAFVDGALKGYEGIAKRHDLTMPDLEVA